MKLEELIRRFRDQQNLTMQEFADRCGLSKGYVSMLEKGQHPQSQRRLIPSLETLKKVSVGMRISLDELLSMLDGNTMVILVRDPYDGPLSSDERQLIEDYRDLTPPGKEYIRQTMAMAKKSYCVSSEIKLAARGDRVDQLSGSPDLEEIEAAIAETPSETE